MGASGQVRVLWQFEVTTGSDIAWRWKDWTTSGGGAVGTIFAIYTQGAANGTPFLTIDTSTGVKGITFWYPNQNASSITPYPYTIAQSNNSEIQNVILVNSYQGIYSATPESCVRIADSTIIGSPLLMGLYEDGGADYDYQEDIRFSPAVWSSSGLPGAPAVNGPHATWMRQNGTGLAAIGLGGGQIVSLQISGYSVGILLGNSSTSPTLGFYQANVTNCASAIMNQNGNHGTEFTDCTLIGDIAVNQTSTLNAPLSFHTCTIQSDLGSGSTAIVEANNSWQAFLQFQDCQITGMIQVNAGSLIATNSTINAPTQCTMASTAYRAVFSGCTFLPSQNIVNQAAPGNLIVDSRQAAPPPTPMPTLTWTTEQAKYAACRPAKTTLYVATTQYGATGNGQTDDTTAIQNALNAAGSNGGGIVYLPGGQYKVSASLTVPTGVELRGVYELRHYCGNWSDDPQRLGKASVLEVYEGAGSVSGPPAVVLKQSSGIVGVDIEYPTNLASAITAFPPTIQGQGANVYALAVICANSYYGIDLDTYACPNHFLWNVDGSFLGETFVVGNGSNNGWIVDCENHLSYWNELEDSTNPIGSSANLTAAQQYSLSNLQMFVLGNCQSETLVNNSSIFDNTAMHCIAEGGVGPSVNGFQGDFYDVSHQGFVFDANGPSTINMINQDWMVTIAGTSTNSSAGCPISSTSAFQGTARFFNFALVDDTTPNEFNVNGGDVGGEAGYFSAYSPGGSIVNAGTLHLINIGCYASLTGPSLPIYPLTVGNNAGTPGKVTEFAGAISGSGFSLQLPSLYNPSPIECWTDVSNASGSVLSEGALPTGWTAQDIGSTGATGSTSLSASNVFTLTGAGSDIGGSGEGFQFCSQPISGNCTIIARVDGIGNTNSWAKAGVMIRNSLNAGDLEAEVVVTPGNGVSFQYPNGFSSTGGTYAAPYWVELQRNGNTFSAQMSPDGINWTSLGSPQTIAMGSTVYVGLAVTSHDAGVLTTGSIDQVSLSP